MRKKEGLYAVVGGCVGAVLTMAVCSLSPLGAQSQLDGNLGKIICTGLTVVDPDATPDLGVRVRLGYDERGNAEFYLYDRAGDVMHGFIRDKNNTLYKLQSQGNPAVTFLGDRYGDGSIAIMDGANNIRHALHMSGGVAQYQLNDAEDKEIIGLYGTPFGGSIKLVGETTTKVITPFYK